MSFVTHEQNGLRWLTSPLLDGVRHGFSTRQGGVSPAPWDTLNLGPGRGDAPEYVEENYRRFCACVGTDVRRTVLSKQVHETTVRIVTAADADVILFLQDASDPTCSFSPGMAGLFPKPSIGIVTKCDLCPDPQQRAAAEKLLALAGVQVIFHIGLHEKDELEKLVHFLMQQEN